MLYRLTTVRVVIPHNQPLTALHDLPQTSGETVALCRDEAFVDEPIEEILVKSKQRVSDHGEVFTPSWMVEDMLDLVKSESERIDSRFMEPACGSGNFLKAVLKRKLQTVSARYRKSEFERRHYALLSLMSIYGIELLEDNIEECRRNLLSIYADFLGLEVDEVWLVAGRRVLQDNILQGDALTLLKTDGSPIEFPEWGYLGTGKFQRRNFRFEDLTQRGNFSGGGGMWDQIENPAYVPTKKTYAPMTVEEIAK